MTRFSLSKLLATKTRKAVVLAGLGTIVLLAGMAPLVLSGRLGPQSASTKARQAIMRHRHVHLDADARTLVAALRFLVTPELAPLDSTNRPLVRQVDTPVSILTNSAAPKV
jgi:hypothetical protein